MQANKKDIRVNSKVPIMVILPVILLLLLVNPYSRAYGSTDYVIVERESYRLYNQQKWDSVIIVGKQAFKEDIDYFYLRLRVGIAYYWLKKYMQATEHLQKAHEFNSIDPMVSEYLYLSYLYSGKEREAYAMINELPEMVREKLGVQKKILEQVHVEGGYTFSSDDKQKNHPYLIGKDSIYGEQDLYGNHSYTNLDLTFNLSPKINLTVAYNYLRFSETKYFQYGYSQDRLDSTTNYWWGYENHYSWNKLTDSYSVNYQVKQHELFVGSIIQLPGRVSISPSFHLIYIKYPETYSVSNTTTVTDTIFVDSITPNSEVYSFKKNQYSFNVRNRNIANYVVSLSLTKDFSIFSTGLSGSYSNLNNLHQSQLGWNFSFYPLGNSNLYGVTEIISFFQEKESRMIFHQRIGGRVLPRLWLEGSGIVGDLTNVNLSNGFIVYNNTDKINYRIGATLLWTISKNIDFSIIYQYFNNQSIQVIYSLDPQDSTNSTTIQSNANNIHRRGFLI